MKKVTEVKAANIITSKDLIQTGAMKQAERQKQAIKVKIDENLKTVSLSFANNKILILSVDEIPEDVAIYAMLHGFKQKLVDAAAISRDTTTGRTASIDDKYDAVVEVLERLKAGSWNKEREGRENEGGLLLQALIIKVEGKKTIEQLKFYLEGLSSVQKAALKLEPSIKKIIDGIQLSRLSKEVNVKDLLDGLDDI